jgi:hypothetical protein
LKENFTRLNQQIQQLEKDLKSMSQLPLTVKMSDFDPKKTSAENWASMQPTNINPIITDIFPITKLKSLSIRNLNKYSSEEILLEFSPERIIKIFTTLNTHFPEIVNHVRKTIKSHENNNYIATDDAINEFDFFEIINLDKKGIEERINADLIKLIIIKLNNKFLFINEIINQENELEALKINEEKEFNHLNLNRLNEISRLNSDFNSLKRTFNLFYNKYQNNLYPFEMKPTNEDFSNGSKQAQSLPMGKEAEEIMNRYDEYEKNKTLPLFNPLLKTEHVN